MSRLFFSGVMILTVTNLIVKLIGLMFKIPMNYIVGDEGMGYYNSAYTFYTYLYMVSTAGLPTAISIMIADSRAAGRIRCSARIFRVALVLFLILGAASTAVMFFFAGGMSDAIGAPDTRYSVMAIAPTLFFICVSSALRGYFQGYQQMLPVAVSQLTEALCKLAIGITFAMYAVKQGFPIYIVAAYATVGLTVGAGLGMMYLIVSKLLFHESAYNEIYIADGGEKKDSEPTRRILRRLVVTALPITLSASVMSLTNLIDMALVQRLLQQAGFSQSAATELYGNYTSLAVPMFNLPPVLVYPIAYSIVPLISAAKKRGDAAKCALVARSSIRVAMLVGIPCSLGLSALAKPVLSLLYVEASASLAAPLLTLLAPSAAFVCVLAVTNAVLQANGFERCPLVSMLVGAGVKIVSNYFLIQFIGMRATPVSTFLCYLTVTVLNLHFVHKHAGVLPPLSSLFVKPLLSGTLSALGAYFTFSLLAPYAGEKVAVFPAVLSGVIIYVCAVLFLGGILPEDVLLLPKGEKILAVLNRMKFIKK